MFLFSATFFPISTYPSAIQWVVRFSPLYHAIRLERAFNLGLIGWAQAVDSAYLLVLGLIGVYVAQRRVGKLLLK
jgi:lipooligosaccharide transport system permease protein